MLPSEQGERVQTIARNFRSSSGTRTAFLQIQGSGILSLLPMLTVERREPIAAGGIIRLTDKSLVLPRYRDRTTTLTRMTSVSLLEDKSQIQYY